MIKNDEKYQVLKKYFGYSTFRDGQDTVIDALTQGRDSLAVMPTGAGKSLCFQVPALLFNGISIVVSPLISLMKDQVNALTQSGIPSAFINSSLQEKEYFETLQYARAGKYKLVYVAPERLLTEGFIRFAQQVEISMISIDEAHCVSQWGQDFRPSYLKIREFVDALPNRPVLGAFTATATTEVREDIIKILRLERPEVVSTGFDRKNLYFEVRKPANKMKAVLDYLNQNRDKSGIVYCATRKSVEEVCETLQQKGYDANRYHAGLSDEERRINQEDFLFDRKQIMVATNAFGMGIDKSNVAFVIHYNMPKNMESYYQEAGRAGRDGAPAECLLLYGGQDVITNQFFIENSNDNEEIDRDTYEQIKAKDRQRLKVMTYYCHTHDCFRKYILNYFGENAPSDCGNCSNCNQSFMEEDITISAQKILSCVKRAREGYGVKMIIDTLRGSENERILRSGLNNLSTHGIMSEVKEKQLREMINYLILQEYLHVTSDAYPVLKLTEKSKAILFEGKKVMMKVGNEVEVSEKAVADRSGKSSKFSKGMKAPGLTVNLPLFEQLKAVRSAFANKQGVPAFVIFSDATLMDMCVKIPKTEEEFLDVSGVGQVKLEKYGKAFLKEIREYDSGR